MIIIEAISLSEFPTYFIFRETGVEVRVLIKNGMISPSHKLKDDEIEFIKTEIGEKNVIIESSIGKSKRSKRTVEY